MHEATPKVFIFLMFPYSSLWQGRWLSPTSNYLVRAKDTLLCWLLCCCVDHKGSGGISMHSSYLSMPNPIVNHESAWQPLNEKLSRRRRLAPTSNAFVTYPSTNPIILDVVMMIRVHSNLPSPPLRIKRYDIYTQFLRASTSLKIRHGTLWTRFLVYLDFEHNF